MKKTHWLFLKLAFFIIMLVSRPCRRQHACEQVVVIVCTGWKAHHQQWGEGMCCSFHHKLNSCYCDNKSHCDCPCYNCPCYKCAYSLVHPCFFLLCVCVSCLCSCLLLISVSQQYFYFYGQSSTELVKQSRYTHKSVCCAKITFVVNLRGGEFLHSQCRAQTDLTYFGDTFPTS